MQGLAGQPLNNICALHHIMSLHCIVSYCKCNEKSQHVFYQFASELSFQQLLHPEINRRIFEIPGGLGQGQSDCILHSKHQQVPS